MSSHMSRDEFLEAFKETTDAMYAVAVRKNHDYTGNDADPFANLDSVEKEGICQAETGILVRMTDKYKRIISLTKLGTQKVLDESIDDTLLDLANYCILMRIRRLQRKRQTKLAAPMDRSFELAGTLS